MINKKQTFGNNANRKRINGTEEKRFSKSKFKKDNVTLEDKREENAQEPEAPIKNAKKTFEDYQQEYSQMMAKRHYDVEGEIESVKTAILTKPSLQAHGYSVLAKGQCVVVTKYVNAGYRKVVAQDGRVGIIPIESEVKSLNSLFK